MIHAAHDKLKAWYAALVVHARQMEHLIVVAKEAYYTAENVVRGRRKS